MNTQNVANDDLLKLSGAAVILNCSMAQVYRMAQCGTIPAMKIGSVWRVSRHRLMKWIADQHAEHARS